LIFSIVFKKELDKRYVEEVYLNEINIIEAQNER
jgi:hypothetical protein